MKVKIILLAALAVLALMNVRAQEPPPGDSANLILLIDRSWSMSGTDCNGQSAFKNALDQARLDTAAFFDANGPEAQAWVWYYYVILDKIKTLRVAPAGGEAHTMDALDTLENLGPCGRGSLERAMTLACGAMDALYGHLPMERRTLIVYTDGGDNLFTPSDLEDILATECLGAGTPHFRVYTPAPAGEASQYCDDHVVGYVQRSAMEALALRSGGSYTNMSPSCDPTAGGVPDGDPPALIKIWNASFPEPGITEDVFGVAMAPNTTGGVAVAGHKIQDGGNFTMLTVQYDAVGEPDWSRSWPDSSVSTKAVAVAVDGWREVVTVGNLDDSEMIASKYDKYGQERWTWQHCPPGFGPCVTRDVDVGPDGHPVVIGYGLNSVGIWNLFVYKLDRNTGAVVWEDQFNLDILQLPGYNIPPADLKLDPDGNVYILTARRLRGGSDGLLALKYQANGVLDVAVTYYGPNVSHHTRSVEVAFDEDGNIYALAAAPNLGWRGNVMLVKWNSEGVLQWRIHAGDVYTSPKALSVYGNAVYVTCSFGDHLALLKYDSCGAELLSTTNRTTMIRTPLDMDADGNGPILLAYAVVSLGPDPGYFIYGYDTELEVMWQTGAIDYTLNTGVAVKIGEKNHFFALSQHEVPGGGQGDQWTTTITKYARFIDRQQIYHEPGVCGIKKSAAYADGDMTVMDNALVDGFDSRTGPYGGANAYLEANLRSGGQTTVMNNAIVTGTTESNSPNGSGLTPVPEGLSSSGDLNLYGNLDLPAGDYLFGRMDVQSNARLTGVGGPVRIWFTGPVTINSNAVVSGAYDKPSNLQWFSAPGSGDVEFKANSVFKGSLQAPDRRVTLHGGAAVYGAISGSENIIMGNAELHYDQAFLGFYSPYPLHLRTGEIPATPYALQAADADVELMGGVMVDSYLSCEGPYGGNNVGADGDLAAMGVVTLHETASVAGSTWDGQLGPLVYHPPEGLISSGDLNLYGGLDLTPGDYLFNNITVQSGAALTATGGLVRIWFTGDLNIQGNGAVQGSQPGDLVLLGLTGPGQAQLQSNSELTGVLYAPGLDVIVHPNATVYGALTGASILVKDNARIHYDASLNQYCY